MKTEQEEKYAEVLDNTGSESPVVGDSDHSIAIEKIEPITSQKSKLLYIVLPLIYLAVIIPATYLAKW